MFAAVGAGLLGLWIFGTNDKNIKLELIMIPAFFVEYITLFFRLDHFFSLVIIAVLFTLLFSVKSRILRRKLSLLVLGLGLGGVFSGIFIYSDLFWWPFQRGTSNLEYNLLWFTLDLIGLGVLILSKKLRLPVRRILLRGNHLS
jgi:hypothetical protein